MKWVFIYILCSRYYSGFCMAAQDLNTYVGFYLDHKGGGYETYIWDVESFDVWALKCSVQMMA